MLMDLFAHGMEVLLVAFVGGVGLFEAGVDCFEGGGFGPVLLG